MSPAHCFAQVLLDTSLPQLDHLFDYEVPLELRDVVRVGQRVRVPLRAGARQAFGYVVALRETSEFQGNLSALTGIVSPMPVLTPNIHRLARTLADRAAGSANDILRLAIPTRQVRVEKAFIAEHGEPHIPEQVSETTRTPKRQALTPTQHPIRLPTGEWVPGWVETVAALVQEALARDESIIVAMPDHYDVEVMQDALLATVPRDSLVRMDAQQSNASRYQQFLTALVQRARVIVGNRSTVYAPAYRLGAIVLVDDGDSLFEEPLSPYVHARDAALVRSELESADLYFVANSRSIEVHRLATLGYVDVVPAPRRSSSVVLTASMSTERASQRLPSHAVTVVREALSTGPVLVQVPSPGFATAIFCASCSERQRCIVCAGPMELLDGPAASGRCRWCRRTPSPLECTVCGSGQFREVGAGSARTADQFTKQFPKARILTSDGETRRVLVDSRPAIVVATRGAEPLAAGGYSAVLLLDAERMLAAESLRAEEDALRVWANAAALARPGAQIVLTEAGGALASNFALGSPERWLDSVLAERKLLRYPPAVRVACVSGPSAVVATTVLAVAKLPGVDVLENVRTSDGVTESIVRFDYAAGEMVAAALRSALISNATVGRRRPASQNVSRVRTNLKLHFDDPGAFDERRKRR